MSSFSEALGARAAEDHRAEPAVADGERLHPGRRGPAVPEESGAARLRAAGGAARRRKGSERQAFPAGTRWNYSNTGYVLLGIIVHKVSGMFYGDVLATRVFKPVGMTTTRVISEADIVPNRAAGYELVKGEVKNQSWVSPTLNTTADGSLYFSVRDLVAWEAAVRARRVLKPASWHEVLQPVRLASGKTYPYGFGWGISERGGQPLHEHGGAWQGFQTQFSRFLGDDLSIVVLANLAQARPERFTDALAGAVDPTLAAAMSR